MTARSALLWLLVPLVSLASVALIAGGSSGGSSAGSIAGSSGDEDEIPQAPIPMEATMQGGLKGYDFTAPDFSVELPKSLREISGLITLDETTLACVQDERGELFTIHLDSGGKRPKATKKKFGPKGDYEGLAKAGTRRYVLRSDGAIFELDTSGKRMDEPVLEGGVLPHDEFESVAYEPRRGRLLIAPKGARTKAEPGTDSPYGKNDRFVYALGLGPDDPDLGPKSEPVLVLSVKAIVKKAAKKDWPLPTRTSKKGNLKADFEMALSDLAVHPITGDYYLLCGKERVLLAVSPKGKLLGTALFAKHVLAQPEGLAFQPNGDLYLCSEGAGQRGKLLLCRYLADL